MSGGDYSINELLDQGRRIWGWRRMRLDEIVPAMGVVFGDICRVERDRHEHWETTPLEVATLKREIGNMILSSVRWASDLGLDPNSCIDAALEAQKEFVRKREGGT